MEIIETIKLKFKSGKEIELSKEEFDGLKFFLDKKDKTEYIPLNIPYYPLYPTYPGFGDVIYKDNTCTTTISIE